jgi:hypothetical protein
LVEVDAPDMSFELSNAFYIDSSSIKSKTVQDSHSIACGDDNNIDQVPMSSTATDARDMVKDLNHKKMVQNSFGCNTEATTTSEKHIDATRSTNEIGS